MKKIFLVSRQPIIVLLKYPSLKTSDAFNLANIYSKA